jgi:hypothetical protein
MRTTTTWLPWIAMVALASAGVSWLAACEDTGPSPIGVHPDDAEAPAEEDASGEAATEDASDEGGDAEEDATPEKDSGGTDAKSDAADAADADAG